MTTGQLQQIERMWRAGYPVKQIARAVGVSESTVTHTASRDRGRFPRRGPEVSTAKRDMWVARVLAGRATRQQAADALGVTYAAVWKWCDMEVGQQ